MAVLIQGTGAMFLGLLLIVAAGGVSVLIIAGKKVDYYIAAGIGICLSLAGLVFSVVRLWQHLNE